MVNPRRIASIYEWKQRFGGAIMSVNIQSNNQIDLAIAPSLDGVTSLESLETSKLRKEVSKLEYLVQKHSICAFVIGWPLTEDGRMGASCGKVLYFLDTILSKNQSDVVLSKDRPFTLYKSGNQTENYTLNHSTTNNNNITDKGINCSVPDEWGRSVCFSQDSSNSIYTESCAFSSCADDLKNTTSAASLLKQFIDDHWQLSNNDLNPIPRRRGFKKQLYEVLSMQNTPQLSIDKMESDHVYLSSALL